MLHQGKGVDWVPIDPEDNTEYDTGGEVEVTSEGLLLDSYGDIDSWLFLMDKHIKCGLADWYMKQCGDENRERRRSCLKNRQ